MEEQLEIETDSRMELCEAASKLRKHADEVVAMVNGIHLTVVHNQLGTEMAATIIDYMKNLKITMSKIDNNLNELKDTCLRVKGEYENSPEAIRNMYEQ